jgi:hypothetical protein
VRAQVALVAAVILVCGSLVELETRVKMVSQTLVVVLVVVVTEAEMVQMVGLVWLF